MALQLTDLTPSQEKVLRLVRNAIQKNERIHIIWAGSIRAGKSSGAVMALLIHSMVRSGEDYGVASDSIRSVNMKIVPIFREVAGLLGLPFQHFRSISNPHMIIGTNKFHIFGGDDEKSRAKVQGFTLAGLFIDELTNVVESFVRECEARCSKPGALRILTFNKLSPHHWTARNYYFRAEEIGAELVDSDIYENQHIDETFIKEREREYLETDLARKIKNVFAFEEGLIYPEMEIVNDDSITYNTPAIISLDWGAAGTVAALAFHNDGLIYDEYYYNQRRGIMTEEEHLEQIVKKLGEPNLFIIDPNAVMFREVLRRNRYNTRNAVNQVMKGIRITQRALKCGDIKIHNRCENLLNECTMYRFDELREAPIKEYDHACDAMRYGTYQLLRKKGLKYYEFHK